MFNVMGRFSAAFATVFIHKSEGKVLSRNLFVIFFVFYLLKLKVVIIYMLSKFQTLLRPLNLF